MFLESTVYRSPRRLNLGPDRGEELFRVREFMSPTRYGDSAAKSKIERSIAMKMNRVLGVSVFAVLLTIFLLPAGAHAQPCNAVVGTTVYLHINDALAAIGPGPGTISVTGSCSENVQINNSRNITIVGLSGAS